jgi:selenocysteine lyase/cysteine desulfurase
MSVSERVSKSIIPHAANWYGGGAVVVDLRVAAAAGRDRATFRCIVDRFSVLGSGLTLPWLASLDRAAIEAHTLGLASRLRTGLQLRQEPSAIVSIPTVAVDALRRAGIRASIRAGAVRVGFHLYNNDDDLDRLLDALR